METTTLSSAIQTGTSILTNGWNFISGNSILFGICTLGLVSAGIFIVKKLF